MSRMRQITHTSHNHESNLDALLDDLQTTVSRSNSQLNLNGTGYREVGRTVIDGAPQRTVSQYQIEYLNPANSTHHISETSHGYAPLSNQRQMYKAETYNYGTTEHRSDAKLKQNISELDSLLEDLNTAQRKNFSSDSMSMSRHAGGIDSGLLEAATPQGRVLEEKHYREEKVVRGRSSSPRRELVFTGTAMSRDPSPITPVPVRQQQFYRYEKSTTTRTTGPMVTDVTPDSSEVLRSTHLGIEDGGLRQRSPSPGPAAKRIDYHYTSSSTTDQRDSPHYTKEFSKYRQEDDTREYSPQRYTTGRTGQSYSYTSSSRTRESRSEVPRSPPPHRSPSPVSFTQPPTPSGRGTGPYAFDPPSPPAAPQSPSLSQRFSPSDPSQQTRYKYTSTTTTSNNYGSGPQHPLHPHYPEDEPLLPRPFPAPSPTPNTQQQPPKKLDELMATFSETEIRNRRNETIHSSQRYERDHIQRKTEDVNQSLIPNGHGHGRDRERIVEKEKEKQIVKKEESKNMQGPPVYYPPGVELFSKKEEALAQQQSGGAMYKAKAKYEYESKSKSKSKESSGKAVVPVCLPVCCAMPCTIM